jgi:hypothetical protein
MDFTNKTYVLNYMKFCGMLGAIIGLVFGIFYAFGGLIIDFMVSVNLLAPSTMGTPGLGAGTLLAFGALIGMPAIFAVVSIVLGMVLAGGYNLLSYFKD